MSIAAFCELAGHDAIILCMSAWLIGADAGICAEAGSAAAAALIAPASRMIGVRMGFLRSLVASAERGGSLEGGGETEKAANLRNRA